MHIKKTSNWKFNYRCSYKNIMHLIAKSNNGKTKISARNRLQVIAERVNTEYLFFTIPLE